MSLPRKISYVIFAALAVAVIALHFGAALVVGLFSFMILDLTYRRVKSHVARPYGRLFALTIFLVVATLLTFGFGHFISLTVTKLPSLIGTALPKVEELIQPLGVDLPFANIHELRTLVIEGIRENTSNLTKTGGVLTREFVHILMGVIIAILCFMSDGATAASGSLLEAVREELGRRMTVFMAGFEKIFSVQIAIAMVNTTLTATFLLLAGVPYVPFLILSTFILGMLPLIGNILSNSLIVGAAIMISAKLAVFALAFLVIIHKLEYFLFSQLAGTRIKTPMWQILAGILVGEAVLGVPGIMLTPVVLNYVREELQAIEA